MPDIVIENGKGICGCKQSMEKAGFGDHTFDEELTENQWVWISYCDNLKCDAPHLMTMMEDE